MQIFKSKTFKRISALFVLIVYLMIGVIVTGEILTPVSYATYFNHDIEIIENDNEAADLVFIGASRVYRSYIPEVFEQKLNMNCVINAGSSSQPTCGTYYQLKDLVERVHPKNVVIGVTWGGVLEDVPVNQQGMLIVYDRLSLPNKIAFALDNFQSRNILYCLRPYRFKDNFNWNTIRKIYGEKQILKNNDYVADTEADEYYADTGFVYSKATYETGTIPITENLSFNNEIISEENLSYLDACIKLCQAHNISVHLVTGITSMATIYCIENYQKAVDFYTEYANRNGIIYHNLNYLLNREEIFPDELMHDYNHVNGEGAYILSEIYAEILAKDMQGVNTNNYFYENFDELKKDVQRIVAVKGNITIDEKDSNYAHIIITSLQNDNITPYYQLEISKDNGENFETLTEWTKESELEFIIPKEGSYKIKVSAKSTNENDAEAYQIYTFD